MRYFFILGTISLLLLAACQTQVPNQTKYVCSNGRTVDQISDCTVSASTSTFNLNASAACPSTPPEQQYAVTAEYLSDELKKDPKLFLLDVREKEEFDKSHLEGARNIPIGGLWKAHFFKRMPRDDPIIIYDNDGIRTAVAYRELARFGYKNIVKLAGGIGAWQEAGYLIVENGQLQKGTPVL